jgi:hypothetical protein
MMAHSDGVEPEPQQKSKGGFGQKSLLAVMLMSVIISFANPDPAFAARSGGRAGGRAPAPRSAPRMSSTRT